MLNTVGEFTHKPTIIRSSAHIRYIQNPFFFFLSFSNTFGRGAEEEIRILIETR